MIDSEFPGTEPQDPLLRLLVGGVPRWRQRANDHAGRELLDDVGEPFQRPARGLLFAKRFHTPQYRRKHECRGQRAEPLESR